MVWTLWLVGAAFACDGDRTLGTLLAHLDQADVAFGRDEVGFRSATDATLAGVVCLEEAATPSLAARAHRTLGLRHYVDGDLDAARRAFAAARRLDPEFTFPAAWAPDGHPLRAAYGEIDQAAGTVVKLESRPGGRWLADGRLDGVRVAEWPAWLQGVGDDGRVLAAEYSLEARTAAPGATLAEAPASPPLPAAAAASRAEGAVPRTLTVASIATAVLAGAVYGGAYAVASDYRDQFHTDPELEALRGTANTLVVVSGVAGAGAVVLGVGAVVSLGF